MQNIVIFPFKAVELLRGPSKTIVPEVADLLIKRLSSSVVDNIPLVIIATPADILELNNESSSVRPDDSVHDIVIPLGGEPLTDEPSWL